MKRAREANDDGDDAFDDSDDLMARAQEMMDFDDDDDGSDGSDSDEADEADENSDNVAVQANGHAVKPTSSGSAAVLTKDEPPDLPATAELDEARDVMQLKVGMIRTAKRTC